MTKFISVKVFRGTIPEGEIYGEFAGQPCACFRVATEDDAHVKCFHVSEPPFDVKHLENPDKIKSIVFGLLMIEGCSEIGVELIGAELVAEFKMTPAENGDTKIERIK